MHTYVVLITNMWVSTSWHTSTRDLHDFMLWTPKSCSFATTHDSFCPCTKDKRNANQKYFYFVICKNSFKWVNGALWKKGIFGVEYLKLNEVYMKIGYLIFLWERSKVGHTTGRRYFELPSLPMMMQIWVTEYYYVTQ